MDETKRNDVAKDLVRDELAQLRREVAALRAARRPQPRRRNRARAIGAALALMLALMPLGLFAANFQDLNPGSGHNANINAIADAGISKGCGDTQHYCPNDLVTREEMASFLARTAGLGNNPPVTDAARLQGYKASDFAQIHTTTELRYSFFDVKVPAAATFTYAPDPKVTVIPSTTGVKNLLVTLDVPSVLLGSTMQAQSLEICYDRDGGAFIEQTNLYQSTTGATTTIMSKPLMLTANAPTCHQFSISPGVNITGTVVLSVLAEFPSLADRLNLYTIKLSLQPAS